jgi:replicative DNA helicase
MTLVDLSTLVIERTRRDATSGAHDPIATGLSDIDEIAGGLPVGLTILAAAPGMGCSSLASQIAMQVAAAEPMKSIAIFPVSEGVGELMRRLRAALAAGYAGRIGTESWGRLWSDPLAHALHIPKDRIWVDTGVALTAGEITREARQWARTTSAQRGLIIVDGLHGVAGVDLHPRRGGRTAEHLRRLACELRTGVLAIARLPVTRRRGPWQPSLSELRRYGPVLDHSDLVMLMHRDDYYRGGQSERPGEADLSVWSRYTGNHDVTLRWDRTRLRFSDY